MLSETKSDIVVFRSQEKENQVLAEEFESLQKRCHELEEVIVAEQMSASKRPAFSADSEPQVPQDLPRRIMSVPPQQLSTNSVVGSKFTANVCNRVIKV